MKLGSKMPAECQRVGEVICFVWGEMQSHPRMGNWTDSTGGNVGAEPPARGDERAGLVLRRDFRGSGRGSQCDLVMDCR